MMGAKAGIIGMSVLALAMVVLAFVSAAAAASPAHRS